MRRLAVFTSCCAFVLVACGGGGLSRDGPYFKGLPSSVVVEALANPTLKQNIQGSTPAQQASLAQAAVRNMIFCREELRVYQEWVATGKRPAIRPGPVPAEPLEPGNTAIVQDYMRLKADVASGDASELRTALTAPGSCGQWVPATDTDGPTIAQVVGAQGA